MQIHNTLWEEAQIGTKLTSFLLSILQITSITNDPHPHPRFKCPRCRAPVGKSETNMCSNISCLFQMRLYEMQYADPNLLKIFISLVDFQIVCNCDSIMQVSPFTVNIYVSLRVNNTLHKTQDLQWNQIPLFQTNPVLLCLLSP